MIPILYDSTETAFTSNGLARLRDCLSCVCTEERNGVYEVEFQYPVDGANFDLIQCGRIIAVTHDDSGDVQPFDIVSYSKPIDGIVTFHAVHISYRQTAIVATGKNINSLSAAFALLSSGEPSNPFTYESDFSSSNYFGAADGVPHSVKQMLGGMEGSILDSYGGEFEWDRFKVRLKKNRGQVRDFSIRYGVNLLDYSEETDYQNTWTSAIPYWVGDDGRGGETIVVGNRVDTGLSSYNGRNMCLPLDLSDKFETKPTKPQLQTEANSYLLSNQSNMPQQSITVDFVRLQDLGYEDLNNLLRCGLCDSIRVIFPRYGMEGLYKIVKTEWDVLEGRYISLELGSLSTTLAEALGVSTGTSTIIEGQGGGGEQFIPTLVEDNGTKTMTSGTSLQAMGINETLPSGYWIIAATIRYTSSATGYRSIAITKDGTQVANSLQQQATGGTGNYNLGTVAMVKATAAWVFDLQYRQNSGSSMSNVPWYYQAIKVGEIS